jgi:molecular chaperone Hsp33
MFQDYIFYGCDAQMRYAFRLVHLSELLKTACQIHGLPLQRARVLGEALLGSNLISTILDEEESLNLRVQVGNDYTMACETSRYGSSKGYIEFHPESFLAEGIDEGSSVKGEMTVRTMRWNDSNKQLYQGITKSDFESTEGALNQHLHQSFQNHSTLRIASWIDEASQSLRGLGIIYFELPHLDEKTREELWNHVEGVESLADLFEQNPDPDVLVQKLVPHPIRPIKSLKPVWECGCSQASIEAMILKLSRDDIDALVLESKPAEITCHYCSSIYQVSVPTMMEMLKAKATENPL